MFQILSQLIDERQPPLPPIYLEIFPPLLTQFYWERKGNIPALVRLLQSYLAKAGPQIVENGHLQVLRSLVPPASLLVPSASSLLVPVPASALRFPTCKCCLFWSPDLLPSGPRTLFLVHLPPLWFPHLASGSPTGPLVLQPAFLFPTCDCCLLWSAFLPCGPPTSGPPTSGPGSRECWLLVLLPACCARLLCPCKVAMLKAPLS